MDTHNFFKKDRPLFGESISPYHWWFAWKPIQTYDGRLIWLQWIKRRRIQKHGYLTGGADFWWQYRHDKGYVKEKLHDPSVGDK